MKDFVGRSRMRNIMDSQHATAAEVLACEVALILVERFRSALHGHKLVEEGADVLRHSPM